MERLEPQRGRQRGSHEKRNGGSGGEADANGGRRGARLLLMRAKRAYSMCARLQGLAPGA